MAFDAEAFLEYFGFEKIKNHDDKNIMASCFQGEMHTNDDNKRSFGIRKDIGVANCYVCGGWSLEQLTKELLNRKEGEKIYNEFDALKFLEEKEWLIDDYDVDDLRRDFENMEGVEFIDVGEQFKPKAKESFFNDSILEEYLKSIHKKSFQRGKTKNAIDLNTAKLFQLGYDKQTRRIIIPVREEYGELVGVISRAVDEEDYIRYSIGMINPEWNISRYTNKEFNGEKMLWVFNKRDYVFGEHLWYETNEIGERKLKNNTILVLESPLDVVYAYSQGLYKYMNLGAIFGSKCTREQMDKITRHRFVVEALDNDKSGMEGKEQFYKNAEGKCELFVCDSWGNKDLGECTPFEVQEIQKRFKPLSENLFSGIQEII